MVDNGRDDVIKLIEKYYRNIRDLFWVAHYRCAYKLAKEFLERIEDTNLLKDYRGRLCRLVTMSKDYRKRVSLGHGLDAGEPDIVYTIVAPLVDDIMRLIKYLEDAEALPVFLEEIDVRGGRKLSYFIVFFELEKGSVFEARIFILTHRLLLEQDNEAQVSKIVASGLQELKKDPNSIWYEMTLKVEAAPSSSMTAQIWARRVYANVTLVNRRLYVTVLANDMGFDEVKNGIDAVVKSLLKTLAEKTLLKEDPLEYVFETCKNVM